MVDNIERQALLAIAKQFAKDLAEMILRDHRITGDLGRSIRVLGEDEHSVQVGSDLPYAIHFENQTHAVAKFTRMWVPKVEAIAKGV